MICDTCYVDFLPLNNVEPPDRTILWYSVLRKSKSDFRMEAKSNSWTPVSSLPITRKQQLFDIFMQKNVQGYVTIIIFCYSFSYILGWIKFRAPCILHYRSWFSRRQAGSIPAVVPRCLCHPCPTPKRNRPFLCEYKLQECWRLKRGWLGEPLIWRTTSISDEEMNLCPSFRNSSYIHRDASVRFFAKNGVSLCLSKRRIIAVD